MDAQISSSTGKTASVSFRLRVLPGNEKRKKALKALLLCWAGSLATIPLPPIHWVTVPGLFFLGFYMFYRKLREGEYTEPFAFACPECQKEVKVEAMAFKPEWEQVCPSCHFALKIDARP